VVNPTTMRVRRGLTARRRGGTEYGPSGPFAFVAASKWRLWPMLTNGFRSCKMQGCRERDIGFDMLFDNRA
jgi:hypothetical protein